jgi:hypothetical protein
MQAQPDTPLGRQYSHDRHQGMQQPPPSTIESNTTTTNTSDQEKARHPSSPEARPEHASYYQQSDHINWQMMATQNSHDRHTAIQQQPQSTIESNTTTTNTCDQEKARHPSSPEARPAHRSCYQQKDHTKQTHDGNAEFPWSPHKA